MKKLVVGESERAEFKDCRGTKRAKLPDDLWQSIAAFSNSHGGKIFLGIEDNGTIVNLSPDDADKLQKDLSTLLSNNFFNNKPIYSKKLDQNKFGYGKDQLTYEPPTKKCAAYLLEQPEVAKIS